MTHSWMQRVAHDALVPASLGSAYPVAPFSERNAESTEKTYFSSELGQT